jgi:hypothetical protein
MEKKQKEEMSMDKKAKLDLLKSLRKMAMGLIHEGMGEDDMELDGMKKVTVAAKDSEGLKKGLEKAEDILEDMPLDSKESEDSDDMEELAEESSEEMSDESDEIAELEAKLAALKAKKLKA